MLNLLLVTYKLLMLILNKMMGITLRMLVLIKLHLILIIKTDQQFKIANLNSINVSKLNVEDNSNVIFMENKLFMTKSTSKLLYLMMELLLMIDV